MVMSQAELTLALYFVSMGAALIAIICGFILFIYRKAVFQAMRLKFLSWRGYIIIDFIAKTKKSFRYCLIPKEGFIEIPGRSNEKYSINEDAIVLEEGKFPRLTIVEGEAAPVNYQMEDTQADVLCPKCNKEISIMVPKPKSINPGVFDAAMMKAKSIGSLLALSKEMKQIILYTMISIGVSALAAGLIYYNFHEIGKTLAPIIKDNCKQGLVEVMLEKGKAFFA